MDMKTGMLALLGLTIALAFAGTASAQAEPSGGGMGPTAGLAIGAGLAVGLAGLATGIAQMNIGAAAVGAIAEDPAFLGRGILMVAIPETIVIFGFVVAFLLYGLI